MKIVIFGASGMVGMGALLECLDAPDVDRVVVVGRSTCGVQHAKVEELLVKDFLDLSGIEDKLRGVDACFFCLGVSAAGMSEADYRRVTFDYTVAAAEALLRASPGLSFIYVSGQGTDSSEKGRSMWARVKGATENRLVAMPFKRAVMFRPGFIQPVRGTRSKTRLYRGVYVVMGPLFPLLNAVFPRTITDTARVGQAMLRVAREGCAQTHLENAAINALALGDGRARAS